MLWISFMACPAPLSPTRITLLAMAARIGRHASTMAARPPTMSVSLPASAALAPPVMPQSTYSRPVAAANAASSRVAVGCDVVRSMRTWCWCGRLNSPPCSQRTARISVELGTMSSPARAPPKASGDLRATACDRPAACKASPLKSQATARRPARSRFLAMPRPICPRPTTATSRRTDVSLLVMPTPHCDNCLDGMVEIRSVFEILDVDDALLARKVLDVGLIRSDADLYDVLCPVSEFVKHPSYATARATVV